VFVGSPDLSWHGIDELVALATRRPEWTFDVIGPSAPNHAGPGNVRYLGFLEPAAYQGVLDRSDVALSTLALYRKQMAEACPLKAREYLARGLPVLGAYHDTDFPAGAPFLCELPACANSLRDNWRTVDAFVHRMRGYNVSPADVASIDSRAKEEVRLEFFASVSTKT